MKYPFVVQQTDRNYAASAAQFATLATAGTREELERLMAEQLALVLEDARERGEELPAPLEPDQLDLSAYEGEAYEVVYVEPATINPVSQAIERALERAHLSQAEVARRMGVTRSVVSRLTNPFYFGHSLSSLQRLADALNADLEVDFKLRAA